MTSLRLSPERLVRTGGIIPGRHPQGRRLTPCLAFRDEGAYRVTLMMDIHIGPSRVETLGISYIGPMFFFSGKISYTWLICGVRKVVRTMNGGFNSIIIYTWLHIKVLMRKSWTSGENHWTTRGILQQSMFDYRMVAGWIWITELEAWGKSAGSCSKSWTLWFSTYIWDR